MPAVVHGAVAVAAMAAVGQFVKEVANMAAVAREVAVQGTIAVGSSGKFLRAVAGRGCSTPQQVAAAKVTRSRGIIIKNREKSHWGGDAVTWCQIPCRFIKTHSTTLIPVITRSRVDTTAYACKHCTYQYTLPYPRPS